MPPSQKKLSYQQNKFAKSERRFSGERLKIDSMIINPKPSKSKVRQDRIDDGNQMHPRQPHVHKSILKKKSKKETKQASLQQRISESCLKSDGEGNKIYQAYRNFQLDPVISQIDKKELIGAANQDEVKVQPPHASRQLFEPQLESLQLQDQQNHQLVDQIEEEKFFIVVENEEPNSQLSFGKKSNHSCEADYSQSNSKAVFARGNDLHDQQLNRHEQPMIWDRSRQL